MSVNLLNLLKIDSKQAFISPRKNIYFKKHEKYFCYFLALFFISFNINRKEKEKEGLKERKREREREKE